jgi:hypothetical protein
MISQKIQALFDFINFLDENKSAFEKYIPLCNDLKKLDIQRNSLNPENNYKDKYLYDEIQDKIKDKFKPIIENIYNPITTKLLDLKIWAGDDIVTSIWNNNISEISDFKRNFSKEDAIEVFKYKLKYLNFRQEVNNDFLCLSLIFSALDEILKQLFDFFKDTIENEFDSFESKTVKISDFNDFEEKLKENRGKNVKYSIPIETFFGKNQETVKAETSNIQNIIMGDKIEIRDISNNSGQISIGKNNKSNKNENDEFTKKSFHWQKWGIITGTIFAIVTIIITIIYSN